MFGFSPVSGFRSNTNWNWTGYKHYIHKQFQNEIRINGTNPNVNTPYAVGVLYEIDIDVAGTVTFSRNGAIVHTVTGAPIEDYKLALSVETGGTAKRTLENVVFGDPSSIVFVCDEDMDGIPNHCDLDSDGDGCSDAVEAGVVTLVDNATYLMEFPTNSADTNMNGMNDDFEGMDYTGSYNAMAIDTSINACDDKDGDGVADLFDLDNDNDGIPDTLEQLSCMGEYADFSNLAVMNPFGTVLKATGGTIDGIPMTIKMTEVSGGNLGTGSTGGVTGFSTSTQWVNGNTYTPPSTGSVGRLRMSVDLNNSNNDFRHMITLVSG